MEGQIVKLFMEYGLPLLCVIGLPAVAWLGLNLLAKDKKGLKHPPVIKTKRPY